MTDLFDRLFPGEEEDIDKIAVHQFRSALDDYAEGETTRNQIIVGFNLDTDAVADLDVLLIQIDNLTTVLSAVRWLQNFESVCILAEGELKYTAKIDFATRLDLI